MKQKKGLIKGLRKALDLAWKMLKWLEENNDREDGEGWQNNIAIYPNQVAIRGFLKSFRTVHKFRKEFKGLGKFERNSRGATMDYELELTDPPLKVSIQRENVLSKENRPNLNAVGLIVDIMESIEKNKRGNALDNPSDLHIIEILKDEILEFIEIVDDKLNETYGVK